MTEHEDNHSIHNTQNSRPVITFDYSLYDHYLEDTGLSEDQKREFLEIMWALIVEIMSLGFDVHPVQQAQAACGKLSESRANLATPRKNKVKSKDQFLETDFIDAANGSARRAAERIQE
jgi:hypothetical protein